MNPNPLSMLNQSILPCIGGIFVRGSGTQSSIPEDDAAAVEIVGRQLHLHAIARIDADPVPAHPSRGVGERLVTVVEPHAVHAGAERLEHLALELDLLFFSAIEPPWGRESGGRDGPRSASRRFTRRRDVSASGPLAPSAPSDSTSRPQGATCTRHLRSRCGRRHVLATGVGVMNPYPSHH